MKIDQIAIAIREPKGFEELKEKFGLKEWTDDIVTSLSIIGDPKNGHAKAVTNKAHLRFNYELGIELEVLQYLEGESFHDNNPMNQSRFFFSHIGIHVDDAEPMPDLDLPLLQETFTREHTNKFFTDPQSRGYGRKYHYRIYQLAPGVIVKYIKRMYGTTLVSKSDEQEHSAIMEAIKGAM